MENQNYVFLKDNTANPAPLGLLGFALTTILLNIHNAGGFALGSTILAMGITIGGISQVIAGILEWKKNNTFGTTAFTAYGFFWLSLVLILILPKMGYATAPDKNEMAAYLALWGLFTLFMFIGTLRLNVALQLVFGTLVILFFLLAIGDFTENTNLKIIAGYEGIVCGLFAFYAAMAQVLNEVYGKTILPIGVVTKK
ncbi:MAG: acetate uptake transporter [Bacteroidetes bacterium]|nr:acetate uptake transporter [Bacteroidota bacterium]